MNNKIITKITSSVLLCTIIGYTTPIFAFTKDETVYSKINSNGDVYNTLVNSHIKNDERVEIINDISDLLNITNVHGDESFEQNGNNLIWNAAGSDIYYQGNSQKDLPIDCEISYELNGEKISTEDIAGKSGKVKITLNYINKDSHTVNINGKKETLYTPFTIVCGTIINNDNNRNIQISTGKVIDNGNKTIVLGICLPGLQASLNLSKNSLEIPSSIEITMDATDFELNNIVTYVTPKIIEENDLEFLDEIDKIYSKVNTLQDASQKLEDGANTLKDGTNTYSEKSKEFNSALNKLQNGVSSADTSYSELNKAISLLNSSSRELQAGAKSISDNTTLLSEKLTLIDNGLGAAEKGAANLKQGEEALNSGLTKIIDTVDSMDMSAMADKLSGLNTLVEANIKTLTAVNQSLQMQLDAGGLTKEQEAGITKQITANKTLIATLQNNSALNSNTAKALESDKSIATLVTSLKKVKGGVEELQTGTDSLYKGISELKDGSNQLAAKSPELSQGAYTLYQGTSKLVEGTNALNAGSTAMKKGLNTLNSSTKQLTSANGMLVDGANTLSEGATSLADGVSKLNNEGITPIVGYINKDLKSITTRIDELQKLSNDYNNFTMLNNGDTGEVKFIMIIDSIKKDDNSKQEIILDTKNEKDNN